MPDAVLNPPLPADIGRAIRTVKTQLRRQIGDVATVFAEAEEAMRAEATTVAADREAGRPVWPVVQFRDIAAGTVPAGAVEAIRRRGCVVVRDTFPRPRAEGWDAELASYAERNRFAETYRAIDDGVFGGLAAGKPSIYPIYWSKPQIEARQDGNMVAVRKFLNSFWKHQSRGRIWFDPDRDTAYPDRVRRRPPGANSAGLSPHTDSVMCSAFRTFQGWTALSDMPPDQGVLHAVPIPAAMGYLLLRALQADVADDDLCGAVNGQSLPITDRYHPVLLPALTPIPAVQPGDTVWWHADVIHSVGAVRGQNGWGNVMYIPAAPYCDKNAAYARACGQAFLTGASPADFAAEDYETTWAGRATPADLNDTGRKQLGLQPW